MAPKVVLDSTWALGTNSDSPPHFTPTIGGPDPLGAVVPRPNGQKGSKKAQKGQLDISPDARTAEHSSHSCTTGAPELRATVHPFHACVPPHTSSICRPRGPNGSPQSPKMALYWLKVGPKWSQHRSALRKTVQNGSSPVKIVPQGCRMGAPVVLTRQIWSEKGFKGPFSAKFVRFSLLTLPQKG